MAETKSGKKRILVLGAGFGGLEFAKKFSGEDCEVVIVDRQNHHLFQPLLYQVATAGLAMPDIAQPVREILRKKKNVTVLLDEVTRIDLEKREVGFRGSVNRLSYDYLVLGLGTRTNYFGNDHWADYSMGLKTLDDAVKIRHDVLLSFERAESTDDRELRKKLMTMVVIGGGPTGLEMAGALSELSRNVLRREFRRIDPAETRIVLIEAVDRVLPMFSEELSASAERQLEELGVEVITGQMVKDIQDGKVVLPDQEIVAENIIWTAGVSASRLTQQLGVELDKAGRIKVKPDLSLPDHPEVFALGDLVHLKDAKGQVVPGVSPAAIQTARHAAKLVEQEVREGPVKPEDRKPFTYFDKGYMATIGRRRAVARVGKFRFSGFPAWLSWLLVHLVFLVGLRNKISVFINWFYAYINYKRGARIITGIDRFFRDKHPDKDRDESKTQQPEPDREKVQAEAEKAHS